MARDELWAQVAGRRLRISNLDKLLYPGTETTKGEVLHYYTQVSGPLLAVLADRPVTRVRWPDGTGGPSFFEKNIPSGAPSWLNRVTLSASGSRTSDDVTYPLVHDLADLTYLTNLASLELHVPQWQVASGGRANPDRLVIDLDPGAPAGLPECATLALVVRDHLHDAGCTRTVPVTSGSKGMQVYAALDGSRSSDDVRDWARTLAMRLTKDHPDQVVWKMTRSIRPGKVLLDWSQNTAAKTTIAPYSLRGKDRPTVAAPRSWAEVADSVRSPHPLQQLDLYDVMERLERDGDLFAASLK
ncbi:non-homologous end-joining DNA ligase [Leekyejoonella antrihumi]|uniref:ATP-dependent DNA ligase n=1 Tax=Leekyejoonella antrihumi TaxID=1660198 RepID=A0A563DXM3_9MICO|nr:non-homologous end-joining DNA ligase [Leekyejoonella antrihumi]TWP34731.1 ATP-dependent DNA ligase [Leekyejoonella antrihumi]